MSFPFPHQEKLELHLINKAKADSTGARPSIGAVHSDVRLSEMPSRCRTVLAGVIAPSRLGVLSSLMDPQEQTFLLHSKSKYGLLVPYDDVALDLLAQKHEHVAWS